MVVDFEQGENKSPFSHGVNDCHKARHVFLDELHFYTPSKGYTSIVFLYQLLVLRCTSSAGNA